MVVHVDDTRSFYWTPAPGYASEPVLVEALDRLLDRLQPAEIDSAASYAIDGSFLLAHDPHSQRRHRNRGRRA
jgi:hypothetical protein